jgi:2-haloacid dehalogenase
VERWATFDCYGTLIDWNGGIGGELARLFGEERRDDLLARYHELEPEVQAERYRSYEGVLETTLGRLAKHEGLKLPDAEQDALARSLPDWPPFPEVPSALEELRSRGWSTAILSNSDRALIQASERRLGVPFELTVVAEEVGSYKPEHGHWKRFAELATPEPGRHVHVAASRFHDVAPAAELGIPSVWINRLGEPEDERPARTLTDLAVLPDTLDELVPA